MDKNGNAFDSTMWCQAIWALKMITLIQSNLLRREFVCACVCVCLLPLCYENFFFQALWCVLPLLFASSLLLSSLL